MSKQQKQELVDRARARFSYPYVIYSQYSDVTYDSYDVVSPNARVYSRQTRDSAGCRAAHEIAKHQAACEREHE